MDGLDPLDGYTVHCLMWYWQVKLPTCGDRPDDMTEFVVRDHCQPAQRQEGADQEDLVEAFHKISSPTTLALACRA